MPGTYLIDGGSHIDTPLSNLAIKAFEGGDMGFVGMRLFPAFPVGKQSDLYYEMDPDVWLRVPDTNRAPKAPAHVAEWKVSTANYFAKNYALRTDNALETLTNADVAIRIRENSTMFVLEGLMRDKEQRIANLVSSVTNVGSGVALTGADKWSSAASDPISTVKTGHAFVRQRTGLVPNTLILDYDTAAVLRDHPQLIDRVKYTQGPQPMVGGLSDAQLASVFRVQNVWVATGIYNSAKEGATGVRANIWGNVGILAHVRPGAGLMTATAGLSFMWQPAEFPSAMVVERYMHPDPSAKTEYIESQYFADEKIVAKDLIYTIKDTL